MLPTSRDCAGNAANINLQFHNLTYHSELLLDKLYHLFISSATAYANKELIFYAIAERLRHGVQAIRQQAQAIRRRRAGGH